MSLARRIMAHRVLALALVAAMAIGAWAGWIWLRDVSVLRVKHVEIDGASGREAPAITRALRQTAKRMTTLHVREDELERAVDAFPVIRSVSASVKFPSTLRIRVDAHEPVAVLTSSDGRRIAVSETGIMLRGIGPKARLPEVEVSSLPDSRVLRPGAARVLVGVLGGAAKDLRPYLTRAYATRAGARVAVRDGPVIEFGRPVRIAAKWAAATRVLADPGSSGAKVIDVRLPERPAARGGDDGLDAGEGTAATGAAGAAASAATAAATQTTGAQAPVTGPTAYAQP